MPTEPIPTGIYQIILDGGAPGTPILLQGASQPLTIPASSLPLGTHSFTVIYSGDNVHSSATSPVQTIIVTPPPSFTMTATPDRISGSRLQGVVGVKLTLTPIGIFTEPVTFSCTGLPDNTSCLFSPSSVTFSGQTPSTDELTFVLNTGVTANSRLGSNLLMPASLASIAALAFLIPLRRGRRMSASLFAACALALLSALTGCGSGYRPGLSPTGSFSVNVTATSSSVTQSATVSLTLN
jgi:hypothetical protein